MVTQKQSTELLRASIDKEELNLEKLEQWDVASEQEELLSAQAQAATERYEVQSISLAGQKVLEKSTATSPEKEQLKALEQDFKAWRISPEEADQRYEAITTANKLETWGFDELDSEETLSWDNSLQSKAIVLWSGILWFFGIRYLYRKYKWWRAKRRAAKAAKRAEKESWNLDRSENSRNWARKKSWWRKNWWRVVGGTSALSWAAYVLRRRLYKIPWIGARLDRIFNPDKLSFEEALSSVEGNMIANAKETGLKNKMRLHYKDGNVLSVFWQSYKIDMLNRKVEWLNITFPNYEELIATVITIGAAQYMFKGKSNSPKPFSISNWNIYFSEGNLDTKFISWTWFPRATIAGGISGATLLGILWSYLWPQWIIAGIGAWWAWWAAIWDAIDNNNTIAKVIPTLNKPEHKAKLQSFLNDLWWREAWVDRGVAERANTSNPIINNAFVNIFDEDGIQSIESDGIDKWGERYVSITDYEAHKDVFEFTSYQEKSYLHAEINPDWTVKSIAVEDIDISFTWPDAIEQALYLANLVNKLDKDYAWKWTAAQPFQYQNIRFKGKAITYSKRKRRGYVYRVYTKDAIQANIPDLLQSDNMDIFLKRLNTRKSSGHSLWTNKNGTQWRTNTYLDKLAKETKEISTQQSAKAA